LTVYKYAVYKSTVYKSVFYKSVACKSAVYNFTYPISLWSISLHYRLMGPLYTYAD
jgi:hypothetical protein